MEILKITPARIKIASIIRNAILSGEFPPTSELSLTEIAGRLGVSRTPVREAFQTLEAEGLIALRMNKGAIVKPINEDFIVDHFRIRKLMEGEAVFRAVKNGMDPQLLSSIHKEAAPGDSDYVKKAYEEYNQTFHTLIWKAAGGQKLHAILESLWNGPSYSRAVADTEHQKLSIKEHAQILRFIAKGDAEKAREAMYQHIERSMENVLKSLKNGTTANS
ncbi:MAG: GntR family transcriptional regulator [Planctomycetota bacterium]|jgi:DNA-binding GntR family transcriptional regulator|nr:GntR family transcriptional regulator [Planctomycetota bacterium]